MNEKKDFPYIRFPEFTEPWKRLKLSNIVEIGSGMDYKHLGEGDIPVYGTGGYMLSVNKALSQVKDAIGIGRKGTIDRPFILRAPFWTVDTLFYCTPRESYDLDFTNCLFQNVDWKQKDESTGVPSLSKVIINNVETAAPTYDEQVKIGKFFSSIDNLISLQRRKIDLLKEYKRGMLQKMFPRDGESEPEIRFPGFNDNWKRRQFSDFTWNAGKRNSEDLDLEPYAVTNDRGFIRQNEAHDDFGYMKDADRKAYNIVMPNSFAYNPARINVGSIGYYQGTENVIVSSLYEVFQTADDVDDRFLWHWFKSNEFSKWVARLQEGSVRLYFYYDKLCECQLFMPSKMEQKRIADAIDSIDNLISLQERKLDLMKEYKKGLLQQMFV